MWTGFLTCLSCLRFWLKNVKADYCEPMFSTAFVNPTTSMVKRHDAAALQFAIDLMHFVVSGSDPVLLQDSAVRGRLPTEWSGKTFQVVVAAMTRPDEQCRQSPLRRVLKSLNEAARVLRLFGFVVPLFFRRHWIGAIQ